MAIFHRVFLLLINAHTKKTGLVCFSLFAAAAICRLGTSVPAQDCGVISAVNVRGVIKDTQEQPVSKAKVTIRSMNMTTCPNSVPIDDLILFTNVSGEFIGELAHVAQDDLLDVSVEAEGYDLYYRGYITYTNFLESIEIIMTPDTQP